MSDVKQQPGQPHRWQPGESGNPNGRPKRTYAITTALQELLNGTSLESVKQGWLDSQNNTLRVCQEIAIEL